MRPPSPGRGLDQQARRDSAEVTRSRRGKLSFNLSGMNRNDIYNESIQRGMSVLLMIPPLLIVSGYIPLP